MEVSIDASEVTRLAEILDQAPQVIAAAKQTAIAAAAPKLKAIVDEEIGGSGRVRNWQESCVGSGGGYAAVRPRKKTYAESKGIQTWAEKSERKPKRYAVGYLTNAINNGHRAPRDKWGYRHSTGIVATGKQFYQRASARLGQISDEAAESIGEAVVSHLSGGRNGRRPKKESALYERVMPAAGGVTSFTVFRRR